jgi:hypothetical protein
VAAGAEIFFAETAELLLTLSVWWLTLTIMRSKDKLIDELTQAAQCMVQGSLSEITRQCGDPSCACFHDPARRHGPHLYLKFNADAKTYSVYVPPEQGEAIKRAHGAWLRFQGVSVEIAAGNRGRFLGELKRQKQAAKLKKEKARGKLR